MKSICINILQWYTKCKVSTSKTPLHSSMPWQRTGACLSVWHLLSHHWNPLPHCATQLGRYSISEENPNMLHSVTCSFLSRCHEIFKDTTTCSPHHRRLNPTHYLFCSGSWQDTCTCNVEISHQIIKVTRRFWIDILTCGMLFPCICLSFLSHSWYFVL